MLEQQEREKARSKDQEQGDIKPSSPITDQAKSKREGNGDDFHLQQDDNIDPTMLQYMKLISQRREVEKVSIQGSVI